MILYVLQEGSSVAHGMTRLALHYEEYHCNDTIMLEQSGDKVLSRKACNLILDWSSKALACLLKMPFLPLKIAGSINIFSQEVLCEQGGV